MNGVRLWWMDPCNKGNKDWQSPHEYPWKGNVTISVLCVYLHLHQSSWGHVSLWSNRQPPLVKNINNVVLAAALIWRFTVTEPFLVTHYTTITHFLDFSDSLSIFKRRLFPNSNRLTDWKDAVYGNTSPFYWIFCIFVALCCWASTWTLAL
jgi:hypothetical protein